VTADSFKTWWNGFLVSHPEKPQWPVDGSTPATIKLTGKQLFERGALSLVDLEAISSSSPAPVSTEATSSSAKVDWALFADESDLPDDDSAQ
jgi:hypothetical protein